MDSGLTTAAIFAALIFEEMIFEEMIFAVMTASAALMAAAAVVSARADTPEAIGAWAMAAANHMAAVIHQHPAADRTAVAAA
jgi:hypothetical protein